jgi:hypothetical protein
MGIVHWTKGHVTSSTSVPWATVNPPWPCLLLCHICPMGIVHWTMGHVNCSPLSHGPLGIPHGPALPASYIPSDAHFSWLTEYTSPIIFASFLIEKNAKNSKKLGTFQNINHNTGSPHCPRQYPEPIAILLTIEIMPRHACSLSGMVVKCSALRCVCEFLNDAINSINGMFPQLFGFHTPL